MKKKHPSKLIKEISFLLGLILLVGSCDGTEESKSEAPKIDRVQLEQSFVSAMQKHLDAVSNRDLETLKSTMHPNGNMQLILPGTEIIETVDGFMQYHVDWFQDTVWTFETKILNTTIGETMGMAITEIVYREPERNGKPYFNRMIVSYTLQQKEDQWYIIKDHASSVEKTVN